MKFLEQLKQEIIPEERTDNEVNKVIEAINSRLRKLKIKALCIKGGSIAKGTFLKGDYDVDLFVRFDYSYSEEDLSKLLEKALKGLKAEKVHGSRDYFQIKEKELVYEIVPVLDVKNYKKIKNITDMSLLHVNFVEKSIKKNKKLADEIRLAKYFCKAQRIYGAESYIKGFSGYVVELLIINYGSFGKFIKAAAKWKDRQIIDIKKQVKDPMFELNKAKTEGPLILIDPVQPNRNAAAALSKENYDKLKEIAKNFIKNPTTEFFKKKKIDVDKLKQKNKNNELVLLKVKSKRGKEDVVGGKLLKAFAFMAHEINKNEFAVLESGWEWNRKEEALFYFAVKKEKLSEFKKHRGPPLKNRDNVLAFTRKYKKTFEENGRVFADIKRKYTDFGKLVNDLTKSKYLLEKIREIKLLK